MSLSKHRSRTVGKTDYYKWEIRIPPELIKELGWHPKEKLDFRVTHGSKLIISTLKKEKDYSFLTGRKK